MTFWEFDGGVYDVVSFYSVPGNAWMYELTGPQGAASAPTLCVTIPDTTPDGPFTAASAAAIVVIMTEGTFAWPMLIKFMDLIRSSGDVAEAPGDPAVSGDLRSSHNRWAFADRRYDVNSYSLSQHDCWCYELCQSVPALTRNDHIDVRIPDLAPDQDPPPARSAGDVVMRSHGQCEVPWLVFRRFLDLVAADEHLNSMLLPASSDSSSERDSVRPSPVTRQPNRWVVPPATNPPPPDLEAGDWELVLRQPGQTPIAVIRQIRVITGFGLLDTRALLQSCPRIVVTGLDQDTAKALLQSLRDVGATATTRLR